MIKIFSVIVFIFTVKAQAFTLISNNVNMRGWANRPLLYKLNPTNCPANIGSIINAATGTWNAVPGSNLEVKVEGTSSSTPAQLIAGTATDAPVIACDTAFGATTGADPNTTAGIGFVSTLNGTIVYGGLIINVQAGATARITNMSEAAASIIMAHEIGHSLGLGHSGDQKALMYYSATGKTNLSLSQDDMDGIAYLYPRNEMGGDKMFGCGTISNKYTSGGSPLRVATAQFLLLMPLLALLVFAKVRRQGRLSFFYKFGF